MRITPLTTGEPAAIATLSRMADRSLNHHAPTKVKNPDREARRMAADLMRISNQAREVARQNPKLGPQAKLIGDMATTAFRYVGDQGDYQDLNPYQKLGACQGALEAISGVNYRVDSRAIDNAATHVGYADGNFKVSPLFNRDTKAAQKNQALFAVGLECMKQMAGFLNHHSALAIISLDADPRSKCAALFAAGETGDITGNTDISLKMISRFINSRMDIVLRGEPIEKEPVYEREALKIVGGLGEKLGNSLSWEALEGQIIGEIAQKALKLEDCTDPVCKKKSLLNDTSYLTMDGERIVKFPTLKANPKLTPFEEIGEYMGAFDLALSLESGMKADSVTRGAAQLMGDQEGNHFYIRESDKLSPSQRKQTINHITKSGVEGLKVIAEAVDDREALNLLNSIPDYHEPPTAGSLTPGRVLQELKDRQEKPKNRRSR